MNITPSESEFVRLAAQGNLVPVYADLVADFATPVAVYARLRRGGAAFLFESVAGGEHIGRYSFAGCRPHETIAAYEKETIITDRDGKQRRVPTPADPLKLVEERMAHYRPVEPKDKPPFMGGAVGFLGYEYVHRIEPTVPLPKKDDLGMPVMYYMIIDRVVAFDHVKQMARLVVNAFIPTGSDARVAYAKAAEAVREFAREICDDTNANVTPLALGAEPEVAVPGGNFTQTEFEKMVDRSKEYIRAGDIIQVVGSQRFERAYDRPALDLYRSLRLVNPSPYMFILETGDYALVGASPEVHVRLTNGRVETRPIAGTRPRGATAADDTRLEKELLADEKERAEHLMLVDLARNDLGRVCTPGSVEVKEYAIIERYSHVMHIVSQVEGRLAGDKNAYDLMRATFPAGTVSGAPKVRAMQIIAEFEQTARGSYAGALGYFSFDGNLDCCILIRTALLKGGKLYIQSGAGLVADSIPTAEYQETLNKARAMFKAVARSEQFTQL
ncbi:MAG TPA: anthranilate synthase component I [Opitutales bacterium]|jgi:anthranilate synthase component 1|nr:anthranilate synthase component I [Opitutales bacterium]